MILIFNVPLLASWSAAQYFRKIQDSSKAYQWNTVFISVYSMRFIFTIIGGLFALIISYNSDSSMDFMCDRYMGIDYDTVQYTDAEKMEFQTEVDRCRNNFRRFLAIMYIPTILFQMHCLNTLNLFRKYVENVQRMQEIKENEDEDDILEKNIFQF